MPDFTVDPKALVSGGRAINEAAAQIEQLGGSLPDPNPADYGSILKGAFEIAETFTTQKHKGLLKAFGDAERSITERLNDSAKWYEQVEQANAEASAQLKDKINSLFD